MNYEFFLSKDDYRSYSLLRYLEEAVNLSEPILKIQEELSLSPFLLKKTIDQLIDDTRKWNIEQHFQIIINGSEIVLEVDGKYSSKYFLSKYIERSISFDLLVDIFTGKYSKLESFAEKKHISYSSAYAILQDLKKNLKEYQIFFDKKKMYGDQKTILLFIFQLFITSNVEYDSIYPFDIVEEVSRVIVKLESKYYFSRYEKKTFFHYLSVHLIYVNSKKLAIDRNVYCFFVKEKVGSLKEWLNLCSEEFAYSIIIWLYLYDKLENSFFSNYENNNINLLNSDFFHYFEGNFKQLTPRLKDDLSKELTKIHFTLLYYPINKFKELTMNFYFFQQTYPEYYFYLLDYINLLTKEHKYLSKGKIYLFFSYLMLLVNNVPIQLFSDPIKIVIDFSYGSSYNQFIKNNLNIYTNLNIKVLTKEQHEEANIVITNMNELYQSISAEVVVWLEPPRAVDWGNLTRLLLNFKKHTYENRGDD